MFSKALLQLTLFGFYIPFMIFIENSGEIGIAELALPLTMIAFVSFIGLVANKLMKGDINRFLIISSIAWILFFHYNFILKIRLLVGLQMRYLGPIIVALLLVGLFGIYKMKEKQVRSISNIFLLTAMIMFVYPTVLFAKIAFNTIIIQKNSSQEMLEIEQVNKINEIVATFEGDIFYVILDGYGGSEVHEQYMGLDNSQFYEMLNEKGFAISDSSRSNYPNTVASLASSLNMTYLDDFYPKISKESNDVSPIIESIFNSRVFHLLKQRGYRISMVNLSSSLRPKNGTGLLDHHETFVDPSQYILAMYSLTPLSGIMQGLDLFYDLDIDGKPWVPGSVEWGFDRAIEISSNDEKDFVFLHILSPHPPYYFDRNGEINPKFRYVSSNDFVGDYEVYAKSYSENLLGLNKKVESFLDSLLVNENQPIIILQGDHGPTEIESEVLERESINEPLFRTSILNAFLLPEEWRNTIENGMSPVNTFGLVLEIVTGAEYKRFEDVSFHTTYDEPYKFVPIENQQVVE